MELLEKKIREKATKVVTEFNFDKVAAHMNMTSWTWEGQIPSIQRMRLVVTNLIESSIKQFLMTKETVVQHDGGFCVYIYPKNNTHFVKLVFEPYRKEA